jgi:hypothetical protein
LRGEGQTQGGSPDLASMTTQMKVRAEASGNAEAKRVTYLSRRGEWGGTQRGGISVGRREVGPECDNLPKISETGRGGGGGGHTISK